METIEIRDIQYVLAVCEEGSFSRAAERCYISQPALSKIVKKVEKIWRQCCLTGVPFL